MTTDLKISATIEKHESDNPSKLSVLAYKLDTFQNFFLTEMLDIRLKLKISLSKRQQKKN